MDIEVPGEFAMAVHRHAARAVVELCGELDLHAAPRLTEQLAALLDDAVTAIELDASAVTFVDSGGLRAMLLGRQTALARGATVRLSAASQKVTWIVELAGVAELLSNPSTPSTPPAAG